MINPENIPEIEPFKEKPRKKNAFKNDFGVALSVTGCYGMPGASIISSKACLKTGVGILKLALVKENYTACAVSLPEAILIPLKSNGKTFSKRALKPLLRELEKVSAVLIGCGMGISADNAYLVKELLKTSDKPIVLDADGINLIADDIEFLKDVKAPLVLTPHPGEMARLLKTDSKAIESNRAQIAKNFAQEYRVCLVLKGEKTLVADDSGNLWINVLGNPGMASGGSGDMLAGIILALLAKGYSTTEAAKAAVWLHSAAGDSACERLGENAMLPTDMIEELHKFL
ncbi:MAG: NAD(P)H-hydrate dehydratase [Ruminococcaceae bacterium]|nr:NAD(P)H-hydrate dehydratase [Oscillospiraceae bacterium]